MNSDVGKTAEEQQEYADAGYKVVESPFEEHTDRQLLEEIAVNMRVIVAVLDALGQNPMAKAMLRANGIKVD